MFADSGKRTRPLLAGITALTAVMVVAGCATNEDGSSETSAPSTPPSPFTTPPTESWPFPVPTKPTTPTVPNRLPDEVTVDRESADSVALAAARIWFGWDTTRDTSPYDAALRTTPLMGKACQKRMVASAPAGGAGQEWTELARVHARARVGAALGSEERPADRGERATRIVGVTQRFSADKPVPARHIAAMIVLTRTAGKWEVGAPSSGTCGVVTR